MTAAVFVLVAVLVLYVARVLKAAREMCNTSPQSYLPSQVRR